jgi:hypothetical protein
MHCRLTRHIRTQADGTHNTRTHTYRERLTTGSQRQVGEGGGTFREQNPKEKKERANEKERERERKTQERATKRILPHGFSLTHNSASARLIRKTGFFFLVFPANSAENEE